MDIAIIGTGFIGTTLGRALAGAGHHVYVRLPAPRLRERGDPRRGVVTIRDALSLADAVNLAVPGAAVADITTIRRVASGGGGRLTR